MLRIRQPLIRNPKNSLVALAAGLAPVADNGISLPESEKFLSYYY
jgi:hypothetical protein